MSARAGSSSTSRQVLQGPLARDAGLGSIDLEDDLAGGHVQVRRLPQTVVLIGPAAEEGLVVHVIANEIYDLTRELLDIAGGYDLGNGIISNADEGRFGPNGSVRGTDKAGELENQRKALRYALPSGRNFH